MKLPNYTTMSIVSLKDVKISLIHFLDSDDYGVLFNIAGASSLQYVKNTNQQRHYTTS